MAKLPFNDLDGHPLRRYSASDASVEAAELSSAIEDIRIALEVLELLSTLESEEGQGRKRVAFETSLVIRYRRAMKNGLRRRGEAWFRERLASDLHEIHDAMLRLADKHFAHALSLHEFPFLLVKLTTEDPGAAAVAGVATAIREIGLIGVGQAKAYKRVLRSAQDALDSERSRALDQVRKELSVKTPAELVSLPRAGFDGTEPASRQAPRHARRGQGRPHGEQDHRLDHAPLEPNNGEGAPASAAPKPGRRS